MEVEILYFIQYGFEDKTLPEFWPLHDIQSDSKKDRWFMRTLTPDAQSTSKTRKLAPKIGSSRISNTAKTLVR